MEDVGQLLHESHVSLQDDYEVSSPALDSRVAIMVNVHCLGARLTGTGFGGCAVALVRAGAETRLMDLMRAQFPRRTALQPRIYASQTGDGVPVVYL